MRVTFDYDVQCERKVPRTRRQAKAEAHRREREDGKPRQAYKCSWCDHWHVGHMTEKMQQFRADSERRYMKHASTLNQRRRRYARQTAAA